MTDKEIIKALECCCLVDPKTIFLRDDRTGEIITLNMNDVFYLINRQQSEIERLENEVKLLTQNSITEKFPHCVLCGNGAILTKSLEDYDKIIADISSEAIKEFAERLKNEIINDTAYACDSSPHTGYYDYKIKIGEIPEYIDSIVKEMVGDKE